MAFLACIKFDGQHNIPPFLNYLSVVRPLSPFKQHVSILSLHTNSMWHCHSEDPIAVWAINFVAAWSALQTCWTYWKDMTVSFCSVDVWLHWSYVFFLLYTIFSLCFEFFSYIANFDDWNATSLSIDSPFPLWICVRCSLALFSLGYLYQTLVRRLNWYWVKSVHVSSQVVGCVFLAHGLNAIVEIFCWFLYKNICS